MPCTTSAGDKGIGGAGEHGRRLELAGTDETVRNGEQIRRELAVRTELLVQTEHLRARRDGRLVLAADVRLGRDRRRTGPARDGPSPRPRLATAA